MPNDRERQHTPWGYSSTFSSYRPRDRLGDKSRPAGQNRRQPLREISVEKQKAVPHLPRTIRAGAHTTTSEKKNARNGHTRTMLYLHTSCSVRVTKSLCTSRRGPSAVYLPPKESTRPISVHNAESHTTVPGASNATSYSFYSRPRTQKKLGRPICASHTPPPTPRSTPTLALTFEPLECHPCTAS